MSVKNFVQCGLVTPIATDTTELVLVAPTASYQYPATTGGTLVIADSVARPTFYEIISYTHRIDNVLYGVVRAKEGTTARAWTGRVWVYQALTAQDYLDALALKANAANAALTGTPTAPTAAPGTNTNQIATMAALQAAIAALIESSPAALNTLNELAAALGDDPNFASTMTTALAGKEPSIAAGTAAQMWLGNKTWATVLSQVQAVLLTGLGAGTNSTILASDTLIAALAKIQNQLNNKAASSDSRLSDAREWTAAEVTQAEAVAGTLTTVRKWSPLRVWQAVLASSLTGINLTLGTAVTATDTVLIAIGKLQKQITDAATNLAGNVRATVLTGYVVGANAALAATDTVLGALQKLQGQVNERAPLANPTFTGITNLQNTRVGANGSGASIEIGSQNNTASNALIDFHTGAVSVDYDSRIIGVSGTGNGAIANGTLQIVAGTLDLTLGASGTQLVRVNTAAVGTSTNQAASTAFVNAEIGSRAPTKTGGGASGTWPVAITGNAATATALQTARTINGVSFDGSANIAVTSLPVTSRASDYSADSATLNGVDTWGSGGVNIPYSASKIWTFGVSSWPTQLGFDAYSGQMSIRTRVSANGAWTAWKPVYTSDNPQPSVTGNAATATALQTARTINGVSFNGTANITVADATKLPLTGGTVTGTIVNNGARYAIDQNGEIGGSYVSWNNDRMYTVQVSCSNNGAAYGGIRWTKWGERHLGAIDCFAGGTNSSVPRIDFHVGNTANAFVFQQGGHFTAIGNVTAYSDIRLKKDIRVIPDALAKVEQLSGVTYERIDSGERQVGVIAQEVQKVLPEAVIQGEEYLSVAYGNMVGLLIEAVKELKLQVDNQAREIAELRAL